MQGHRAHLPHPREVPSGRPRLHVPLLPDKVGVTEGPDIVRKLVSQREHWQRVINERSSATGAYRSTPGTGRSGSSARRSPAHEVLSPAFELVGLLALFGRRALGVFHLLIVPRRWWLAIAFTDAALTAGAILLDDMQPHAIAARPLRFSYWAPLDLILYRPSSLGRAEGLLGFLRGTRPGTSSSGTPRAEA